MSSEEIATHAEPLTALAAERERDALAARFGPGGFEDRCRAPDLTGKIAARPAEHREAMFVMRAAYGGGVVHVFRGQFPPVESVGDGVSE